LQKVCQVKIQCRAKHRHILYAGDAVRGGSTVKMHYTYVLHVENVTFWTAEQGV